MKRAKKTSLWWDTDSQKRYPQLDGDKSAEIIIIGAGITGLTTALLMQAAGKEVILIEADRVSSGATGYTTAKVTAQHELIYADLQKKYGKRAAATYARVNSAAIEQVAAFVEQYDIDCYLERHAAFTYTRESKNIEKIRSEVDAARQAGLDAHFVTESDLPLDICAAVRLDNQIIFDPRAYCAGLAAAFVANGGTIYEQTRAMDVAPGDYYRVITPHGTLDGEWVILATQIPFMDRGGFFVRTYPMRSYLIAVELEEGAVMPQGMYISADDEGHTMRPAHDGRYFLVGGEGHKTGQKENTQESYDNLDRWARQNFPVKNVTHHWSAQDYVSVDQLPFVGSLTPIQRHLLVATGYSKWGLSLGTAAAAILRDTVLGVESAERTLFGTTRIHALQSAPDFIKENSNVAKHFVGDKLAALHVPDVNTLAMGEGKLASLNGETVAAYRNDAGELTCVSSVCTHLGCTVAWNSAEKSWDCPCHGSRFGTDGRVLQGPAVKNLAARPSTQQK